MSLMVQESVLSNGVRVLTAAMPQVPSVACGIWVGVGGRYESARQSGASHFIEHLLFKGTEKRSARAISQAIEGRGGYFNAFTQEEATCYYARASAAHVWKVLDVISDMYLRPKFDPEDINKERGVILEEIMMYRDQPHQLVQDLLGELMWTNHPVGRPLIGTPENIMRMSREDLLTFKQRKYTTANTRVAFAGQIQHEACVEQVERMMNGFAPRKGPCYQEVSPHVEQRPVRVHSKEVEQTHLAMGFRIFGRHDKRRMSLKLLSVMLGENMSSRLFQVVREKHGLAYSVHSGIHLFAETGGLVISAGLDRAKTGKALQLIAGELMRLMDKPVSAGELQRAKDYAIGQMEIGLESTINQMMWIGENSLFYQRVMQPQEVIDQIRAVTPAAIQQLAQAIFKQKRCSVAMVTPMDSAISEDKVIGALRPLA